MITDADIQKLKAVFATKDDLEKTEKRIVGDIAEFMQNSIIKILDEHEKRIDRLEKHVGGFPAAS